MLEERASQFRAIQRRLLTRFKDKTPAPLANLDTLLNGTYTQVSRACHIILLDTLLWPDIPGLSRHTIEITQASHAQKDKCGPHSVAVITNRCGMSAF